MMICRLMKATSNILANTILLLYVVDSLIIIVLMHQLEIKIYM